MAVDKKDLILSNLDKIEKWKADGKSIRWICGQLGVSKSLFYNVCKDESNGLVDSVKKGKAVAVERIEDAMFNSAIGYTRIAKKYHKVKRIEYDPVTGKKLYEAEEIVEVAEEVYYPPDNTAGIFLLKNWGKYTNEPATIDLRKQELELKKKHIENMEW